jgi:hypothetical protein
MEGISAQGRIRDIRTLGGEDQAGADLPDGSYFVNPEDGRFGQLGAAPAVAVRFPQACVWNGVLFTFGGLDAAVTRRTEVQSIAFFADIRKNQPINYATYKQADTVGVGVDELFGWGSWYDSDTIRFIKQGEE